LTSQNSLNHEERQILLQLARKWIETAVQGKQVPKIVLEKYPLALREEGAAFVTLTRSGKLRGCIGAIEAYQPLVQDVCEHAVAAATEDYRFEPVRAEELANLKIEISRLTRPEKLQFQDAEDLLAQLRPGIDGVVVREGFRRATFLPQVWDKIPDKQQFLENLCLKMGAPANYWITHHLEVLTYQVEEFHE